MTTVISENTRMSGEVIGQALKTIITRMQAVAANKSVDEFGDSLNNVESSLREVGIELRDSTDSFRPLGDVLDEINSKWNTFGETEQKKISGAIAGVRQINILTSLMQNYGDVQKYMTIQNEAAGLSQERYSIYLDGVEAAQNRVTAATERFWQDAISSGNVSNFYNFLAGIIELVNRLGGLETILIVATTALIAYNSATIQTKAMSLATTIMQSASAFMAQASATGVATAAMELFNTTNPLGWIALFIGAIALVVTNLDSMDEKLQKINKSIDEHNNKINELKSNVDRINELSSSYEELAGKESLTKEEAKKFVDIQNELKELVPELSGHFDEYGNFILDAGQSMENLSEATLEQIRLEQELKQVQLDESASLQAKMLLEKDHEKWMSDQAAKRRSYGGPAPASKESEIKINIDWSKSIDDSKRAFAQMSDEGKRAFIDALIAAGDRGKKLAEDVFIPLMSAAKDTEEKFKSDPIEVPIEPVVSDDSMKAFDEIVDMTMDMIKQTKEAEKDALEDELDALEELADAQKNFYESEYEAIKKNADAAKEKLKREYDEQKRVFDDRRRALEGELDSYKKIISAERDRLEAQKERVDYERSLQENTEDLAALEEQIAELSLDNSAEAIAKRKELEAEASELRKKMAEEEGEHQYNLQISALEQEEQKAEEENSLLIQRLEDEERAYQLEYELKIRSIEDSEATAKEKYDILIKEIDAELEAKKKSLEEQISQIDTYLSQEGTMRRDALEMIKKDNESLYNNLLEWNKKYGTGIDEDIISIWEKALDAVNEYRNAIVSLPPPPSGVGSQSPIITGTLGETGPLEQIIYGTSYHSGAEKGVIGSVGGLSSNEYFAKLMAGEVVVNSDQIDRFLGSTLPSMVGVPQSVRTSGEQLKIEMPINVAGNLDKAVMPDLERIVNRVVKKLNDNLMSRGMNRRADAFSI